MGAGVAVVGPANVAAARVKPSYDKITLAEAARRLELPPRTLRRILPPELIESYEGAWPRVSWSQVQAWLKAARAAQGA